MLYKTFTPQQLTLLMVKMKKQGFFFILIVIGLTSNGQTFAKVKTAELIKDLCDDKNVYRFFLSKHDQKIAAAPISKTALAEKLNAEVLFIKDSVTSNAKVWVTTFINCKGELVNCKVQSTINAPEFHEQVSKVFTSLGIWMPGQFKGSNVDTSLLWSFLITNGKFSLK